MNSKAKMSIHEENFIASANQGIKNVQSTDHANLVLKEMCSHYESQQMSDVVLIAGDDGKRVYAHRLVLSASSPYFKAMFTGSLREATEKEVTLNEVQGDILQALVAFCYSGHIELRQDTADRLLITASLFQINTVVTECTNYLTEQLDPSNCLGMLSLADRHNCKELHKKAKDCAYQQFTLVYKNDEFSQLSATQLAELIASDELNAPNEEDVFHSIMNWVNSDVTKREQHIRELLPLVRMTQLSLSFIVDHLEAVCRSNDCQDLLIDALKWHILPGNRKERAIEYTKPRNLIGTLLAIGVSRTDKKINIECYCPSSDKWTSWNDAISYRAECGVATMGDNLILVGGHIDTIQAVSSVVNYNLTTLTETYLKPMSRRRKGLCVAVLENNLYAIGGYDGTNYLNTVERWDPVESTWNYVSPMSIGRYNAGVAVLNGCIYVAGGIVLPAVHCTVECYNPRSKSWSACAPMSVARHCFGMAVSNGFLYVVGGDTPDGVTSVAERYDPVIDKWTMIKSMDKVRVGLACAFLGSSLMSVGGVLCNTVEEWNTETNKWYKKASLTRNYSMVSVCIVPNRYMLSLSDQLQ